LNFINSQYITASLTHLTSHQGYDGMIKNGIKIVDHGINGLIYKPPGFWISVDGDWERWCTSEDFIDVENSIICNVYLKPNLAFIRISTVEDADELTKFILPNLKNRYPEMNSLSGMLNFSYMPMIELHKGNIPTQRKVWANALDNCDGIYYENSGHLHFDTFFNTWDCDSLMLFDPRNATLSKQERYYN